MTNLPPQQEDLHDLLGKAFTILCNKDTRSEEDRLMRKQLEMWIENNSMNIDFSQQEPKQEVEKLDIYDDSCKEDREKLNEVIEAANHLLTKQRGNIE